MADGFTMRVAADDLSRIMGNALAFFPARSPVKVALLEVWPERLAATATDTYTIGRDICEGDQFKSVNADLPFRIQLDRDGWRGLEETARKDKGGHGRLEYRPGDALTYYPASDEYRGKPLEPYAAQDMSHRPWEATVSDLEGLAFWDMAHDLLRRLESNDLRAFDPAYFARFQKVKLSADVDAEKILDFAWQGQTEPMLAKIGPTFRGAIMPIDRDTYADNQPNGDEYLW